MSLASGSTPTFVRPPPARIGRSCDEPSADGPVPTNRILNLQKPTAKMSKSHPSALSRIYITDPPADIHAKIQAAIVEPPVAKGDKEISYDPVLRPGLSNILLIWSALDEASRGPAELAELVTRDGWTVEKLKERVAEVIVEELRPVRVEYERIRGDHAFLRQTAERSKMVARAKARQTMQEVRGVLGLDSI